MFILQIEMAHKVLSSDMAELIHTMRLAQQYSTTLLDADYRKNMLKSAHVLAMDSKNLLDAVDNSRKRRSQFQEESVENSVDELPDTDNEDLREPESDQVQDNVFDQDSPDGATLQNLSLNEQQNGANDKQTAADKVFSEVNNVDDLQNDPQNSKSRTVETETELNVVAVDGVIESETETESAVDTTCSDKTVVDNTCETETDVQSEEKEAVACDGEADVSSAASVAER